MDVRQLRYFVRVTELKSFTRAAEVLHIAQPALGTQIRKLEEELQTQLITRHSRGVELTEAGKVLRERALTILRDVDAAKQLLRDFSGPPRGTVTLGITPSTNPRIATELIQRAATELPNVRVVIKETMNTLMLDWVRAQKIDLALVHLAGVEPEDCSSEPLAEEDAVFVQSPHAVVSPSLTVTLAEVGEYPLVMPALPHQLRSLMVAAMRSQGLEADIAFDMDSISTTLEMVERNMAGCVMPLGAVAKHFADGRLLARTIVEPRLTLTVALVSAPKGRPMSKAEILLRGLLAELVASHSGAVPART